MRKLSILSFVALFGLFAFASCEKESTNEDDVNNTSTIEEVKDIIFVSKEKEKQKILLEEYTGHKCGYCPDGHKRANAIAASYPNQFFVVNIHSGGLASPNSSGTQYREDFRTAEGNELFTHFKITGLPSGIINRTENREGELIPNRGYWAYIVDQIANNMTYVNVAAETKIKRSTRSLTCEVQAYYTETTTDENYVHIAILQNEIIGDQSGGSTNSEYVTSDGKYRHMHMLRAFVTGAWGEAITADENSFYKKTFTYELPESIKNIDLDIDNIEVLVFITDGENGKGKIVNVNKSTIKIE